MLRIFWEIKKLTKSRQKGFTFSQSEKAKPMLKSFLPKAKSSLGFTLIELLIYTVILVIISLVSVSFFIQVVNVTETSRRSREALDNAKGALDTITQEIRHADSVYTPTSVLDNAAGQLSLETLRDVPSDEDSTYVDIYLDSQRLYLKREGVTDQLITSEKVVVTSLKFGLLADSSAKPAIQVTLTVKYIDAASGQTGSLGNSVTLTSTSTLRSFD